MTCHDYADPEREPRYVAECCNCDEPTERAYECETCRRPVCPCCVSFDLRAETSTSYLCSECEGAGTWIA